MLYPTGAKGRYASAAAQRPWRARWAWFASDDAFWFRASALGVVAVLVTFAVVTTLVFQANQRDDTAAVAVAPSAARDGALRTEVPQPAPTTSPKAAVAPIRGVDPRLKRASGVFLPDNDPAQARAFGKWRGSDVDIIAAWSGRDTWSEITTPTWLLDAWGDASYDKVLGVAMLPSAVPGVSLAKCAAGDYDSKWTTYGRNLRAAGFTGDTILRLGWEFNGFWYPWRASDPNEYIGCWRRVHDAVEAVNPRVRWEWSPNRGTTTPGNGPFDPRTAYPGNAFVDIVGVSSYDGYPAVVDAPSWDFQLNAMYGLKFWSDFAASHDKPFAVSEWGVSSGTTHPDSGKDNPYYIDRMADFFASLGDHLAYQVYFNDNAPKHLGSLYSPVQNPKAAAEYRKRF